MPRSQRTRSWIVPLAVVGAAVALAAVWYFSGASEWADADRVAAAVGEHRTSWYAWPASLLVFVVAELVVFPVLVLVFLCGVVFGPWLGTAHAMIGCIASALLPFAIGRRLGQDVVRRHGGRLVQTLQKALDRKGIVAMFVVRKIPAPYTLVNLVCGASKVSWRDFLLGTLLGMGPGIVLITVVGGQLLEIARGPDPTSIVLALALVLGALGVAFALQHLLGHRQRASQ